MEEISERKLVRFKINKGAFDSLQEAINFLESKSKIPFKTNGASPALWSSITIIVNASLADEMEKILKNKEMFVDRSMPQSRAFVNA